MFIRRAILASCFVALSACTSAANDPQRPSPSAAATSAASPPEAAEWTLVWADEFEGDALDRTKWTPEQSCWGGGNDERQCYTDRVDNIEVRDGVLHLKAMRETFTGPDRPPEIAASPNPQTTQDYTSGKIRTRGMHAWKYGRFEVRAKVPMGQGTWPAVWMMPNTDSYGRWPLSGEIDILEAVNIGEVCEECPARDGRNIGENRTISALHFGDIPPKNDLVDRRVSLPDAALPSDAFHVWAVEWSEGLMRFYLDDQLYWEVTAEDWWTASPLAKGNKVAPFDQPFYIMANLAVGGRLSEENNAKAFDPDTFPTKFLIDYVRIYQCEGDSETARACMTD